MQMTSKILQNNFVLVFRPIQTFVSAKKEKKNPPVIQVSQVDLLNLCT